MKNLIPPKGFESASSRFPDGRHGGKKFTSNSLMNTRLDVINVLRIHSSIVFNEPFQSYFCFLILAYNIFCYFSNNNLGIKSNAVIRLVSFEYTSRTYLRKECLGSATTNTRKTIRTKTCSLSIRRQPISFFLRSIFCRPRRFMKP